MLKVKELIKRYRRQVVLKNISMSFKERCINVIIGPSGCGKTTLFNCISGLEPFDHGMILLDDEVMISPAGHSPARLREVGYVLQGFSLFAHLTVMENLTLAPRLVQRETPEAAQQRALELLEKMQIADKQHAYPSQLSGGQQQRVSIARAIMMHPKVLLMDEPTNALDPQLVLALEKTLRSLTSEGLTLIISTHHLDFARRIADTSFFMYNGELLASSDKADLLIDPPHPQIQQFIREEIENVV